MCNYVFCCSIMQFHIKLYDGVCIHNTSYRYIFFTYVWLISYCYDIMFDIILAFMNRHMTHDIYEY